MWEWWFCMIERMKDTILSKAYIERLIKGEYDIFDKKEWCSILEYIESDTDIIFYKELIIKLINEIINISN